MEGDFRVISGVRWRAVLVGVWSRLGGEMGVVRMEMEALASDGMKEEEKLNFFRGRGGELGGFSCSQGSLSWTTKKTVKEEIEAGFKRGAGMERACSGF